MRSFRSRVLRYRLILPWSQLFLVITQPKVGLAERLTAGKIATTAGNQAGGKTKPNTTAQTINRDDTMAFFGSAYFNSTARFDEATALALRTKKNKIMSKLKLELQSKTVPQKLALGETHITAMTGNTNYPAATRVPTDAQVATAQNDLDTANQEADAAEVTWKQKNVTRDEKEAIWDQIMTARANNCEAVTPGNLAALASTGFPLRGAPVPVGDMPAPSNLRATMGDQSGEIDLQWDAIYGASSYIIECKEHDTPQPWTHVKTQQQSKFTATGLTPGKTYAFRVRALGPNGEGPWSDEATKMAP